MHPRHHHSSKRNIRQFSHSTDMPWQPLTIPWQPFDIPNAPNPPCCHLTSLDISKRLQRGVGVVRGVWGGSLKGIYKVSGGWSSEWWSWVVFWSAFLQFPLIFVCQWWDPRHFLLLLVAPKASQIKMSECNGHFAIFWRLEQHFGAEI